MKKLTCLLACLALVCAMMGGAAGEGFQPRLDTKAEYTLTVSGNYGNFEALEAAFDAFGQFYPNAQLQYQQLENYKKMISLALSGDEAPDIYFAYDWMRGREQYAVPLDKAEDLSDESLGLALEVYRPALLNRVEGEKTAIAPIFASAYGMLVNRDIFEKAGLSVPTDWAGFAEACEKLKAAGYTNLPDRIIDAVLPGHHQGSAGGRGADERHGGGRGRIHASDAGDGAKAAGFGIPGSGGLQTDRG